MDPKEQTSLLKPTMRIGQIMFAVKSKKIVVGMKRTVIKMKITSIEI